FLLARFITPPSRAVSWHRETQECRLRANDHFISLANKLCFEFLILTTPSDIVTHFVAALIRGGERLRLCPRIDESRQVGHLGYFFFGDHAFGDHRFTAVYWIGIKAIIIVYFHVVKYLGGIDMAYFRRHDKVAQAIKNNFPLVSLDSLQNVRMVSDNQ